MNDTTKKCYYCELEKPTAAIFNYKAENGEIRPICSDCQNSGKHWGT